MIKEINKIRNKEYDGHSKVFYFENKDVGLRGYVAFHSSKRHITGGTRMFNYKNDQNALTDVLRLSKAMTYKCTFAGLPFGGGKAVIIDSPKKKTAPFLKAYAEIIKSLKGKYTTGTDVGISDEDTQYMSSVTKFILKGNGGGTTTSLMAARGVYESIISVCDNLFPDRDLSDLTISIKGLGKIGSELVRLLYKKGINIIVADKEIENVKKIKKNFPKVQVAHHQKIHKMKVDIYSPCAMWGEFYKKTIDELHCDAIVGGANNQFLDERDALLVARKGIVYIPDYVVNAGGLIQIVDELRQGGYKRKRVRNNIKKIGFSVGWLIRESKKTGIIPLHIANKIVTDRIKNEK